MNAKHTPGPWKMDDDCAEVGGLEYRVVSGTGYEVVALVQGDDETYEREANARLIAEAPAMREALIKITTWADRLSFRDGRALALATDLDDARALLHKIDNP